MKGEHGKRKKEDNNTLKRRRYDEIEARVDIGLLFFPLNHQTREVIERFVRSWKVKVTWKLKSYGFNSFKLILSTKTMNW